MHTCAYTHPTCHSAPLVVLLLINRERKRERDRDRDRDRETETETDRDREADIEKVSQGEKGEEEMERSDLQAERSRDEKAVSVLIS